MAFDLYTPYAISINGTVISGIESQGMQTGLNVLAQAADGQADPTYAAIGQAQPRFAMRTTSVKAFLAVCGISGVAISSSVIVYLQKTAANGIRASGSVHRSITAAAGMVIPRRISATDGQPAAIEFDVIGISSDGTTHPWVMATSVALPAGAGVAELFTVGPLSINGSAHAGVQSMDLDFGLTEEIRHGDGYAYPTRVHISERRPSVTFQVMDATSLATLGPDGEAQGATDSVFYLRAFDRLGTRQANSASAHIKFAIDDGIWTAEAAGDHPGPVSTTVRCTPVWDGTADIIAITADQQIA